MGRVPACQLFQRMEISQSDTGAKKLRSDTWAGVLLALAQVTSMQSNRGCTFAYFVLCCMVGQHCINYVSKCE